MKLLTSTPTVPMTNLFDRRHPRVGCAGGSSCDESDCLRVALGDEEVVMLAWVLPLYKLTSVGGSEEHDYHKTILKMG